MDAQVGTGVLSIDLDAAAGMTTVPFTSGALFPGGVDHLLASISFPETAGEDLVGQASRIAFTFTAAQRDGATR
ncbi:hypothetical protein [Blastococcus saxobsidens]|uniref:Uncharacterized protein n=1 Tax=Blastococcus saxobsidens (strain DD2) TaxID=1146883 RepID=H6RM50_BLASD|nr:hypothetical protein [Blastococcus saxobsidens]CCG01292.1 conserved protein of unknown function [Blastococcus saxobsidens DD2]